MPHHGVKPKRELTRHSNWKACPFPFKRDYGMAARRVPSSAGLPDNWSTEMDEFICYSEAVGDVPARMLILSLKKRFPELNPYAISETAIERRLYCLDRMDNNYFKRGAAIAVQRLEAAGFHLPEPKYGLSDEGIGTHESQKVAPFTFIVGSSRIANNPYQTSSTEPSTPKASIQTGAVRLVNDAGTKLEQTSTARYVNDRYTNREDPFTTAHERSTAAAPQTLKDSSYIPSRMASRENINTRLQPSSTKQASDYHAKDVPPAASLSRLRISEDNNAQLDRSGSQTSKVNVAAVSANSHLEVREDRSESLNANTDLDTSYGSPRTPHGRVRPVGSRSNVGSVRRQNDENLPLGSTAAKLSIDTSVARRYG
ncbi:MAG: hypothetical protein Q9222_003792 [Ikaeria aurantiellina]